MIANFQKEILFDYLLENSQDIISLTDLNLNYVFVSRTFLKMYKFCYQSEVEGKNMREIIPSQYFDLIEKQIKSILLSKEPEETTFKVYSSKGEKVFKRISIPVVENSEITGFLSISRDITNEENLKLKLVEKVYQLNTLLDNEKKLKAQKELFMATLTHDLKNPVQAQLMSLKLLKSQNYSEKELIDNLIESSNYMNNMLCSILNTYKLDNGLIELNKEFININILIQKCINEVKALAKDKSIEILYNSNIKNAKPFADSIQIRRIIGNILNNSLHYGYKDTKLKINVYLKNEFMVFDFENYSDIIPDNVKTNIFDKYVTTNKLSGAGLGLYFCKKAIEAHQGKIYLTTNGHNNKFTFELPLKEITEKSTIKW